MVTRLRMLQEVHEQRERDRLSLGLDLRADRLYLGAGHALTACLQIVRR
jgi:hypothetical protein